MRIAVLAVGTPAEVQRALSLAEELARHEQLRIRTCVRTASNRTLDAQDAELRTWLCAAERTPNRPSADVTPEGTAFVLRLLESARPTEVLELSEDGSWFCFRERHVDLSARRVLARLLATLARARCERPGHGIALDELVAAAWPKEQMQRKSAENRVRVALSTLRSLGLRELLISRRGGLLLDPGVDVLRVPPDAPA